MRVTDAAIVRLQEQGYLVQEGFLSAEEINAATGGLWLEFPTPDDYFADPAAHARYGRSQFAGLRLGPWQSYAHNRLAFHPDLVDLAERFLGSVDLHVYKTEPWAKYAGAVDYDQTHHRDFGNHSIVVPKLADGPTQMTSFILLSDVTDEDGPTKVVPLAAGADIPLWPLQQAAGAFADIEVAVTGPAGTLFTYRTDILHRGSSMTGIGRSRFVLLADYQVYGPRWNGKMAWPNHKQGPGWTEMIERATPRERCLFGFPAPGGSLLGRSDPCRHLRPLPENGPRAVFSACRSLRSRSQH